MLRCKTGLAGNPYYLAKALTPQMNTIVVSFGLALRERVLVDIAASQPLSRACQSLQIAPCTVDSVTL